MHIQCTDFAFCVDCWQEYADGYRDLWADSDYWQGVEAAVSICEPIVKLLRHADSNTPTTGKIHYYASKVRSDAEVAIHFSVRLGSQWVSVE